MKSTDELEAIADTALRTKAKNLRAFCQLGNLAFSLISLGVFIPLYTRTQTNKKNQQNQQQNENASNMIKTSNGAATTFTQKLIKDKTTAFSSFFN